jgi:hypothetical protein
LRQLQTDLESKTGLALADFDVLAQLAIAGGSLRITELADQAPISRSGMTRRVARPGHEGLVRRARAKADARGVVVLTDRLGIGPSDRRSSGPPARSFRSISSRIWTTRSSRFFESALAKITIDCTFG